MTWGPQSYDSVISNFTDLKARQLQNITLPSRNSKPTSNYRLFRLFNYGMKDIQVNFSGVDG
jgi:hypothetical protein